MLILVYNLKCMAKKVFESLVEVTNKDSGETTEVRKSVTVSTQGGDKFFMTFIESLSSFYRVSNITDAKLLAKMCSLVEYNSYRVLIPKAVRKEITDELEISPQTMTNSLKRLKDVNLVTGEDGSFEINPNLFWKGSTKERDKILRDKGMDIKIKFMIEDNEPIIKASSKFN
jgi:hypothetical protein